ncbi:MAG: PAS domain-containing sensor histidine kinase [bacterium]
MSVRRVRNQRETLEYELRIFKHSFVDSSDAIMITDINGKILDVNPAFTKIYGYSRRAAIGKTPRLLRSDQSTPELYQRMWKNILNPRIGFWKGEIVNRCKDGRQIPVLLSITPIRDENDLITSYIGHAIDISEKRELEQRAQQLRREYGAFFRHEMRNMLTVVLGYLELALHHAGVLTNQQQKLLQSAQDSTLVMLRVIDMLKELEQYEQGTIELKRKRVNVQQVIQETIGHLQPLIEESGVEVRLDAQIGDIYVRVDPAKMESVFLNLLKNALEHVAGIPKTLIIVRIYEERERLAVAINNGGEAIPPERLDTFFDRFNTTKKEIGGTGLGTTYAALITRAHGGDIRVVSSTQEGTTVTVLLPRSRSKRRSTATQRKGKDTA